LEALSMRISKLFAFIAVAVLVFVVFSGLTATATAQSPTVGADKSGSVFVQGTDHALWWRHNDGTGWSSWESLGGYLTSGPAAASQSAGTINVFVRGGDNALWMRTYNNGMWGSWTSLGGVVANVTRPAACPRGPDHINVFVTGTDKNIWWKHNDGNGWSNWEKVISGVTTTPGATPCNIGANFYIELGIHNPSDNSLSLFEYNNLWYPKANLGGVIASSTGPAACSSGSGRLDFFVIGTDSALWQRSYTDTTNRWSSWQSLGGNLTVSPAAASPASGIIDVFVRGDDAALYQREYSNGAWGAWVPLGGVLASGTGAGACPY
jgi:hypothetical protein